MTFPTFAIAPASIQFMERYFRERGKQGLEATALLASSRPHDSPVWLDLCILPKQVAERSLFGVSVLIPQGEILDLTSLLADLAAVLRVKFHTHPTDAYHSDMDDENMLMRFHGGLSIVIPDYARNPMLARRGWSLNRFNADRGDWDRLDDTDTILSIRPSPDTMNLQHLDRARGIR